jgi:hypothetical protein
MRSCSNNFHAVADATLVVHNVRVPWAEAPRLLSERRYVTLLRETCRFYVGTKFLMLFKEAAVIDRTIVSADR